MKNEIIWSFVIVIFAVILLTSCVPAMPEDYGLNSGDNSGTGIQGSGISRYVDEEADVVCYVYLSQAISCLPKSDTNLR